MYDSLIDSLLDTLKIIPFLFISYLIMELLEHKIDSKKILKKCHKFGPFIGSILGIIPQCGFSLLGSNLYAVRVISLGTLFSIYLSTSDEMLPILIANNTESSLILKIIFIKFAVGFLFGLLVDLLIRKKEDHIHDLCLHDNCHCEDGIIKSSVIHTLKISLYLFIITFILNMIDISSIANNLITNNKILSPIIFSIIGLIPNCATSVVITELYLNKVILFGTCISGLLSASGLGILVLFKENKNLKENILILLTLIFISMLVGTIINYI